MYRVNLEGKTGRTGLLTTRSNTGIGTGWSNVGKLLNVGQALVSYKLSWLISTNSYSDESTTAAGNTTAKHKHIATFDNNHWH